MKKLGSVLMKPESFSEIVMGNTALVRAMIESGTKVVTSYPGSPTPEIASAIASISPSDRPFYFEFSTNEKVATEVACGASLNGHLSSVFFKSVGLNVALDSFVQLSLFELIGGMVIIIGDDPGANSSQNEQDNRHIAKMSYTPIFEPATPQEAYEMYKEAALLSTELKFPVIVRMTTHVCHAKEKVKFAGIETRNSDNSPRFDPKNGPYIPITALALKLKKKTLEKLSRLKDYSDSCKFNQLIENNSQKGIITCGLPFESLMDSLSETQEKIDILKIAMPFPLPRKTIVNFLKKHKEVKIIEELDPIIEQEVKAIAFDEELKIRVFGKTCNDDLIGEYTPFRVQEILSRQWPEIFKKPEIEEISFPASARPPQMCPGCGHRSAFHAIKQALSPTAISVADIGCHTLGFLEPYNLGQVLLCMGASSGLASGLSLSNSTRKVVAFIGDSTFYHAGSAGILNSVFNKHNFTLIIMENGTTAMTGHQDHPGVGTNFNGETNKIPITEVLKGYGVPFTEVDTYNQKELKKLVLESYEKSGFKVIIARHPCMLKQVRDQKHAGKYISRQVDIDPQVCGKLHTCLKQFACPTFTVDTKGAVTVNSDLCIGDGSCRQTCSLQAIDVPRKNKE
ncbi:MAG: indolepyruvate ferredoxin oxidoreductase [Candidatus Riflebacteria bacterium]|nr:indolepyruvate ferredoxin oxidoreductase [Candidatus Riflebacteria bacterium]